MQFSESFIKYIGQNLVHRGQELKWRETGWHVVFPNGSAVKLQHMVEMCIMHELNLFAELDAIAHSEQKESD